MSLILSMEDSAMTNSVSRRCFLLESANVVVGVSLMSMAGEELRGEEKELEYFSVEQEGRGQRHGKRRKGIALSDISCGVVTAPRSLCRQS